MLGGMVGVLLVHGAWHGPWCWDAFRERLAHDGRDVRTVQLSGHDGRRGRLWYRVRQYVDDVAQAAAGFGDPPAIVGHSLGGLVAQRYVETHPAPGMVLMASVPPGGTLGFTLRTVRRLPGPTATALLRVRLRQLLATPALTRHLLFSPSTPDEVVDGCYSRLQDESVLAYIDTLLFRPPRPGRVHVPVLVLGGELDGVFTVNEVRGTARAYRAAAEIFPGMGHDLMLDTGWEAVADRVDTWLRTTLDG